MASPPEIPPLSSEVLARRVRALSSSVAPAAPVPPPAYASVQEPHYETPAEVMAKPPASTLKAARDNQGYEVPLNPETDYVAFKAAAPAPATHAPARTTTAADAADPSSSYAVFRGAGQEGAHGESESGDSAAEEEAVDSGAAAAAAEQDDGNIYEALWPEKMDTVAAPLFSGPEDEDEEDGDEEDEEGDDDDVNEEEGKEDQGEAQQDRHKGQAGNAPAGHGQLGSRVEVEEPAVVLRRKRSWKASAAAAKARPSYRASRALRPTSVLQRPAPEPTSGSTSPTSTSFLSRMSCLIMPE